MDGEAGRGSGLHAVCVARVRKYTAEWTKLDKKPIFLLVFLAYFSILATIFARGAIAQLGERNNGIVEVRGSIPLGSTIGQSEEVH